MTELPKGMLYSVLIHGAVLGLFVLMSARLSVLGSSRRDIDLILAQTPAPLPNKPPGPTDVGAMAHPPTPDEVLPSDPDNLPAPPNQPQLSPTGPEILKKQQKEKEQLRRKAADERLARIRQGLRKMTPVKPRRVPPIAPPMIAGVKSSDVEKRINSRVANVSVSMQAGGGGGIPGAAQAGGADARGDAFGAALGAALHELWNQPSRAEVGRGNPTVGISITLRADGTMTAFQLTRASGNPAMDASVERLFREHRKFPAPSTYGITDSVRKIEITFELDPAGSA